LKVFSAQILQHKNTKCLMMNNNDNNTKTKSKLVISVPNNSLKRIPSEHKDYNDKGRPRTAMDTTNPRMSTSTAHLKRPATVQQNFRTSSPVSRPSTTMSQSRTPTPSFSQLRRRPLSVNSTTRTTSSLSVNSNKSGGGTSNTFITDVGKPLTPQRSKSPKQNRLARQTSITLLSMPKHQRESVSSVDKILVRRSSFRGVLPSHRKSNNSLKRAIAAHSNPNIDLEARYKDPLLYDQMNTYINFDDMPQDVPDSFPLFPLQSEELYTKFSNINSPRSSRLEHTTPDVDMEIPFTLRKTEIKKTDTRANYISGFTHGMNTVVGNWVDTLDEFEVMDLKRRQLNERRKKMEEKIRSNLIQEGKSPQHKMVKQLSKQIIAYEAGSPIRESVENVVWPGAADKTSIPGTNPSKRFTLSTSPSRTSFSSLTIDPRASYNTINTTSPQDTHFKSPRDPSSTRAKNIVPSSESDEEESDDSGQRDVTELIRDKIQQFNEIYFDDNESGKPLQKDSNNWDKINTNNAKEETKSKKTPEVDKAADKRPRTLQQLRERMEETRNSAWKKKEFEDRLTRYKEEERQKKKDLRKTDKDFIKNQVAIVSQEDYNREMIEAQKKDEQEKEKEKQMIAYERKREIDLNTLHNTMILFNKREVKREKAHREKERAPMKKKLQKKLRVLLPGVLVGIFFHRMDHYLESLNQKKEEMRIQAYAMNVLQTRLYPTLLAKKEARYLRAQRVILRAKPIWILNWRIKKKRKAVAVITQFVQDIKKSSALMKNIQAYVQRVRRCQKLVRRHIEMRRCQLLVLAAQWESKEREVTMKQTEQDLEELRFKIISELTKLKKTTSADAQNANKHRSTKANTKRSAKTVLDAKRAIRSTKEAIVQGFKTMNLPIVNPNQAKKGPIDISTLICTLESTSVLKIDKILDQCGSSLNIYVKRRLTKCDE
jgi:hypothetical protein